MANNVFAHAPDTNDFVAGLRDGDPEKLGAISAAAQRGFEVFQDQDDGATAFRAWGELATRVTRAPESLEIELREQR